MSYARKTLLGAFLVFSVMVLVVPSARAGEISYDLALDSAYVWRGLTFTDGAVFQPAVTAAHDSGFSVNVWGNLDIDDVNGLSGDFQEVDLTLSYGFPSDSSFSAEVGLIEYLFPNGVGDGTREIYVSLGWDVTLSPSITLYYDVDEVEDFYGNFGLSWSNDISDTASYELALSAGYAGEDFARFYGGTDSGFFDGIVSFSLSFAPQENLSISPFIAFVENLDSDVLVDQEVDFHGGVAISVSF